MAFSPNTHVRQYATSVCSKAAINGTSVCAGKERPNRTENKHGLRLILLLLGSSVICPGDVQAHTPPPAPPQFSAYGPWQLCSAGYTMDVKADEGVHVIGEVVRILYDDYLITVVPATLQKDQLAKAFTQRSTSLKSGNVYKFTGPTPDPGGPLGDRPLLYVPQAIEPDAIRYALPLDTAGKFLIIGSSLFKGTVDDLNVLARVSRGGAWRPGCLQADAVRQYLIRSDAPEEFSLIYARLDQRARSYPKGPEITGLPYYCVSGIGFNVENDERLLRPYRSLGVESPAWVSKNGVSVKIEGGDEPLVPASSSVAEGHPLGMMSKASITYYPSRGVGRPYAPENVREDGSWEIRIGEYRPSAVTITFPGSDKTPTGFRFLERLEFTDKSDPRCRPSP